MEKIEIQDLKVKYYTESSFSDSFFCLTDMCRGTAESPSEKLRRWMRNRETIEYLAVWERQHNPEFNHAEFGNVLMEAGTNNFYMSTERWANDLNGRCITAIKGRAGGTYAHVKIAFHLANWLSAEFYFNFITSYIENLESLYGPDAIEQKVKRVWASANYRLHTEAVKLLSSPKWDKEVQRRSFADEGDMLNLVVFHQTATEWRLQYPDKKGNMRDYASKEQLHVLANLENLNQYFIEAGLAQDERFEVLLREAEKQFDLLAKYGK